MLCTLLNLRDCLSCLSHQLHQLNQLSELRPKLRPECLPSLLGCLCSFAVQNGESLAPSFFVDSRALQRACHTAPTQLLHGSYTVPTRQPPRYLLHLYFSSFSPFCLLCPPPSHAEFPLVWPSSNLHSLSPIVLSAGRRHCTHLIYHIC